MKPVSISSHYSQSVKTLLVGLRRQFTANEYSWINDATNESDGIVAALFRSVHFTIAVSWLGLLRFFYIWTAKEAYLKSIGTGKFLCA